MLEVCVDSIQAAEIAQQAGADRIELCSVLSVGGVTPTSALISRVKKILDVPLMVLIRCRAGGFQYSCEELQMMLEEVGQSIEAGADGVVVGAIDPSGELDWDFLSEVVAKTTNVQRVIHRAFDQIDPPWSSIDKLVDIGFHRILTSGGPVAAMDGIERLTEIVAYAKNRIEILPGGGVSATNAEQLLEQSRCNQLHGSFRSGSQNDELPDPIAIQSIKKLQANGVRRS